MEYPFSDLSSYLCLFFIIVGAGLIIWGFFVKDEGLELKKKKLEFEQLKYNKRQEEKKEKETKMKIKEEKEKIKIFYRPLAKYLINEYIKQIDECYKENINIKDIKLNFMIEQFNDKLSLPYFENNNEDYKLLEELNQMHQKCHSDMIKLKSEHNEKVPEHSDIRLFKIVRTMYEKICKKSNKYKKFS